jgi:hypothetical protein
MNYLAEKEIKYLSQFYTLAQIDTYARGDVSKILELYEKTQPKKVPIKSLMNKVYNSHMVVNSPDGWVPVTDCVEKTKDLLYKFVFSSGRHIVASHDHLYQKSNQSWHYARDLAVDDELLSEDGTDRIIDIKSINKKTKVYDLSVNHENHRYYTNGVCSHNSGKSLFMQNLAVNWAQAGLSGVYITLELSEGLCSYRIDSMMTNTAAKDIFRDLDTVEMKVRMLQKKAGRLQIKYMPAQSTVNDIRAYIKELQIQTGLRADFLCVDYLDLLMPVSAKVSPNDLFVKDKYVSEELRNLAKELNILFVTASQLNRAAVEEIEFDHSHISGGISKINTADNVFGIFTSRAMRERGRYQLQLMKTRSSSGVGQKVELEFDIESLRIRDLVQDDGGTGFGKSAPSIYESIKTKSMVKNDNTDSTASDTGKISADVQSAKLKQLLGKIKQP